ncbi:hypothetical protein JG688_00005704 [Phytophthora aleatoria]|uniref:Uncharacterized protein n=1 Tax=Phytophthora aleatoria TaxID=2496075 RepID=A0A8J5J0F8_9STRA|nr:hypothetical protein JG688_00005704 [Phytophthora aleatoria]
MLVAQNRVGAACRAAKLTAPSTTDDAHCPIFQADELVPLVAEADLRVTQVCCQYTVECDLQLNRKRKRDILTDTYTRPVLARVPATPVTGSSHNETIGGLALADALEANDSVLSSDDDEDIAEVQRQNLPLGPRRPRIDSIREATPDSATTDTLPSLLEFWQRSDHAPFHATLVVHGLYDIGFCERGLPIMHLATGTTAARAQASDVGINIADFSRKNKLQPAPSATSLHQILSALQNLKVFSREFYQDTVSNVIDKALQFLGRYGESDFRRTHMCQAIVFWISFKISKFRARVLAGDMALAALVADEFSWIDLVLAEIKEYSEDTAGAEDMSAVSAGTLSWDDGADFKAAKTSDTVAVALRRLLYSTAYDKTSVNNIEQPAKKYGFDYIENTELDMTAPALP